MLCLHILQYTFIYLNHARSSWIKTENIYFSNVNYGMAMHLKLCNMQGDPEHFYIQGSQKLGVNILRTKCSHRTKKKVHVKKLEIKQFRR